MDINIPSLNGNWVDLLIFLVLLFYVYEGIKRKFLVGMLDLTGFLLSFASALKFYSLAGRLLTENFSLPRGISNAAGFLIVGFVTEIIYSVIANLFYRQLYIYSLKKIPSNTLFSRLAVLNKRLGFIPAVMEGMIFVAFVLTLLVVLPVDGRIKKDIVSSKLGGRLVERTQRIDRLINTIFGQAVNETLTFITVNPNLSSGDRVFLNYTVKDTVPDESAEKIMLQLVNSERAKSGLRPLVESSKLRELAREYGRDMFARGYFSHYNPENLSPFERMESRGIFYQAAGENLALAPDVYLAHQGLMNSEGHRENILSSDFGKIGIGIMDGGMYGQIFVQEFTD